MNIVNNLSAFLLSLVAAISGFFHISNTTNFQQIANSLNPLTINAMRQRSYPASKIKIEQTLDPEIKYNRYIASYYSDGLKIYALLLIPKAPKPTNGWPVIILNHGYVTPEKYTPDGNYILYADAFAKNGYLVFKPNYRGNGKSEGSPTSTYFSPDYTVDDLNAITAIKEFAETDPTKIGIWGHSMGGSITLRDLVVNKSDIKVAVIWSGVVGNYNDIIYNWQNRVSYKPDNEDLRLRNKNKDILINLYGTPEKNPDFWNSIDPTFFISDINTPLQIHVGLGDNQVPPDFSKNLYEKMNAIGKNVKYFEYPGNNHDINQSFDLAMNRTILFFDSYLK
jgi:dipeptidyl aminopeptidase/acylaminoacyl peptidase